MDKDEILSVVAPDEKKCECAKCAYGLFGGWDNWKCPKFPQGKPNGILYGGDKCPEADPIGEEENDMDESDKIRALLKAYGARDSEIENFMRDLRGEAKTEKSKAEVYRSLKEKGGSDLIIKLASMPKEEREKAIADYLK